MAPSQEPGRDIFMIAEVLMASSAHNFRDHGIVFSAEASIGASETGRTTEAEVTSARPEMSLA